MIPQIVSSKICNHPGLDRQTFAQRNTSFPSPANILTCKCGKNLLCPVCGWHDMIGVCGCDPKPIKISLHNGSGTPIPYSPKMY